MIGFVLAAGYGTRLAALTSEVPKPLLPVGDSTPFARAVAKLRAAGATRVLANASHLAEQVVAAGRAVSVEVVVEPDAPRGTAGGLAGGRAIFGVEPVLVWNGDVVADLDAQTLDPGEHFAVLAVRGLGPPGTGNVGLDENRRVVRLRQRSFGQEARGAFYAAVMGLSAAAVAAAPTVGCLVGDLLIPWLGDGARVHAVEVAGAWHDIGDLESYLAANVAERFVAADVSVPGNVEVVRSAIGSGVRVTGAGRIDEVVAWPGANLAAPLSRAVVTRTRTVRL